MDEQLFQAYRSTNYRVHATEPFALKVGQGCAVCDILLDRHGVTTGAYLTAWNPYSKPVSDIENVNAQKRLLSDLTDVSAIVLPGEGNGEIGDWPPEPSLFAVGISRKTAHRLAQKYRQNAFVWIERGNAAELVLCKQTQYSSRQFYYSVVLDRKRFHRFMPQRPKQRRGERGRLSGR